MWQMDWFALGFNFAFWASFQDLLRVRWISNQHTCKDLISGNRSIRSAHGHKSDVMEKLLSTCLKEHMEVLFILRATHLWGYLLVWGIYPKCHAMAGLQIQEVPLMGMTCKWLGENPRIPLDVAYRDRALGKVFNGLSSILLLVMYSPLFDATSLDISLWASMAS